MLKPVTFLALLILLLGLSGTALVAEEGAGAKPTETKKEGDAQGESRGGNWFTNFWTHRVGDTIAKGLKGGARQIHDGLSKGADKVSTAFTGHKEPDTEPAKPTKEEKERPADPKRD